MDFGIWAVKRSIGQCEYLTCESFLGSSFRGRFQKIVDELREATIAQEVLLCPDHRRHVEAVLIEGGRVHYTLEGWVYTELWMVRPLYTAW